MKKQILFFLFVSILYCYSCGAPENKNNAILSKISITEKPFGDFEGKPVKEYLLTNANGMQVSIINYGGTVTKIMAPDKNGKMGDVILGYDSLSGYLQKGNPYFGALIGRYGNRIAKGKFSLDGKEYTLAGNDHGNSLHGGNKGFDKVWWNIETLSGDSSLQLTYQSKDGEEGYPGNLNVKMIYTLGSDNSLKLEYTATTDKPTPVNLTSHCYFNLSAGMDSTILNHELMINADKFTPVNEQLIPTGQVDDVRYTPMDFTQAKKIGRDINLMTDKGAFESAVSQKPIPHAPQEAFGYDHNWILNRSSPGLEKVATVYEPGSGRYMEVFTTEPGLQFYSGNFLDGTLTNTKNGAKYIKHGALCLEAQHYPDSPNEPPFPNTILKPGETYHQTTLYRFSVK